MMLSIESYFVSDGVTCFLNRRRVICDFLNGVTLANIKKKKITDMFWSEKWQNSTDFCDHFRVTHL